MTNEIAQAMSDLADQWDQTDDHSLHVAAGDVRAALILATHPQIPVCGDASSGVTCARPRGHMGYHVSESGHTSWQKNPIPAYVANCREHRRAVCMRGHWLPPEVSQ